MKNKLSTIDFIKCSRLIHGDKYDYSLVNYINQKTKVKIICPIHGVFEQLPYNHYKYDCFECKGKKKSSKKEFIKRSRLIHGDKYDYSLVEYINSDIKVKIICQEHGVFEKTPYEHIKGGGCQKCIGKNKTSEDFISDAKKIHGDKYNYSLVNYINSDTKVKIICKEHGIFEQSPYGHINKKSGCPKCAIINSRININDFINRSNKIHNNKYDYSLTEYINQRTKVKIICPIHGIFEQTPNKHLNNRGCPQCKRSKGEEIIKNYLTENKIIFNQQYYFDDCKYKNVLLFDFYLPNYNICIEYDGEQHYKIIKHWGGEKSFNDNKLRDEIKDNYCLNNNINLLRIKYNDNIIEKIKNNLNKND